MREFAHYYRILGLEIGASWDDIQQAYRDLAFVWHPDRLPNDNPRLLEKASLKLKEINEARDSLKDIAKGQIKPKPQTPQKHKSTKSKPPTSRAAATFFSVVLADFFLLVSRTKEHHTANTSSKLVQCIAWFRRYHIVHPF